MTGLAARGLVAGDHVEDAALLLYSGLLTVLLMFLTIESTAPDDARRQVHRLVETAFRGLSPNE